jgi:hypothetical protein
VPRKVDFFSLLGTDCALAPVLFWTISSNTRDVLGREEKRREEKRREEKRREDGEVVRHTSFGEGGKKLYFRF